MVSFFVIASLSLLGEFVNAQSLPVQSSSSDQGISGDLFVPTIPYDSDQLKFYLLTMGVGQGLADRFGHTAIRVVDYEAGTDVVITGGNLILAIRYLLGTFFEGNSITVLG